MACKYPVILVHGIASKELRITNAFGRIGHKLRDAGERVFIADIDSFGAIETNAQQLKKYILKVLEVTGAKKVNLIGHSKGGLDSKYAITHLDIEDKVASLTTLCTPHRGSIVASNIWDLPFWLKSTIAFWIDNFCHYVLRDERPNSMRACEQLMHVDESEETIAFSHAVYCQSFSSTLKRGNDCFLMALPNRIFKNYDDVENDGLVSGHSARFGNYRGECLDISVSHVQIIDFFAKKSHRSQIYAFYLKLCEELAEMGF